MVSRPKIVSSSEFKSVPIGIWCLGFVTLLKNVSSVIVGTFSPLFLREVLGIGIMTLGVFEGGVEAISFFARIFSGVVSDSLRKRKALILVGYSLSLLSRLFLSFSTSIVEVFSSRSFERIGNGIQASPRDALVADLSSPENRGASYGLRQSLTVTGSVLGAALGMLLMWWTSKNYRLIFLLTLIPSLLAIFLLIVGIKEPKPSEGKNAPRTFHWKDVQKDIAFLPSKFWKLVTLSSLFMMANFSISFIVLKAEGSGLRVGLLPLIMIVQNFSTALSAFPFGRLADVKGRRWVLTVGFLILALGNSLLAFSTSLWIVFIATLLWGIQLGITQSNLMAYVAETTPSQVRGTGFGVFHFLNGIAVFIGNGIIGVLWENTSPAWAFGISALIVFLAVFLIRPLTPPFAKNMKNL
jgi:MFS family permease